MTPPHPHDTSLFINRELSWLAFNERVLEEALDAKTPLLERVKFAAIAASNLDEFFMVRVAGLQQAVEDGETSPDLSGLTPVTPADTFAVQGPIDLRVLMGLVELPGFQELRDSPLPPVDVLTGEQTDIFTILDDQDLLLHHPYECYDPVVALLAQAADDPDVLAIKQTLYRTSGGSALIASLQRAAERNKQVTVIVELTARFDEERNIRWARALEERGRTSSTACAATKYTRRCA